MLWDQKPFHIVICPWFIQIINEYAPTFDACCRSHYAMMMEESYKRYKEAVKKAVADVKSKDISVVSD